jgi:hypothetical protein
MMRGVRLSVVGVLALALVGAACGGTAASPDSGSPDGASPGLCGADVPPGQACNALANTSETITPTCVSGTMPAGTGGAIADGTYVLTSQTYYQDTTCARSPLSETISIAGDCIQLVFASFVSGTFSGRLTTQGSAITFDRTCQHLDVDGAAISEAEMESYTATDTTFTLFSVNATFNTSNVAVFTRR